MNAFVYVLVEGALMKVGVAYSVIERASIVVPLAEWNSSWVIEFPEHHLAENFERLLHRLLRPTDWNRPQPGREGGTEFFRY